MTDQAQVDADRLEPCPFCDAEVTLGDVGEEESLWHIGCQNSQCLVQPGSVFPDRADAVEAWNRRARRNGEVTEDMVERAQAAYDTAKAKWELYPEARLSTLPNPMRAALTAALSPETPDVERRLLHQAVDALKELIDHVTINECRHEETHREGVLWTVCDACRCRWADDQGGFQPYQEPEALTKAFAILAKLTEDQSHEPIPTPAVETADKRTAEAIARANTLVNDTVQMGLARDAERARAEKAERELGATVRKFNCDTPEEFWRNIAWLRSQRDAAQAEVATLREVLKPFAGYSTADGLPNGLLRLDDSHPILFEGMGDDCRPVVTVGDFRRARAALQDTAP